ncbi:hypothetical protein [Tautonia rosea]|uniref:hypothetical protein n=1 Tax=Tautonia rosea TaxID=2728037 RepID=UPI0014744273|nr:hypothetical protein [Tautonia rosea]
MSTLIDQPARTEQITEATQRQRRYFRSLRRSASTLLTLSIGIVLCSNPWTSILVIGWTFRLMRRQIFLGWWNQRPTGEESPLDARIVPLDDHFPAATLPRWLLCERFIETLRRNRPDGSPPGRWQILGRLPIVITSSLLSNLRWGILALLCTILLTYPACVLWLGSWYDGWNNSFTKGYENAFVGAQAGLFAHLLFLVAMVYVPMAWGHLAASGQIRAFFQFGLLARMIWSNGWLAAAYAAIFSLATLPVLALRAAPFAFALANPDDWANTEPSEVLSIITRYQIAAGIYLFSAFVILHLFIARLYRVALRRTLSRDPWIVSQLPVPIRTSLFQLRLVPEHPPRRGPFLRMIRWSAQSTSNLFALLTTTILWFTVVIQIYLGQFLNYIPWAGWLNQPLIHLPCLQVIPSGLG